LNGSRLQQSSTVDREFLLGIGSPMPALVDEEVIAECNITGRRMWCETAEERREQTIIISDDDEMSS